MKKIYYFSAAEIPSRTANSVQIMKMCEAFTANGHHVVLFARRGNEKADDPFSFYGVTHPFDIHYCGHETRSIVQRAYYPLKVIRSAKSLPAPDLIYGRHLFSMLLGSRAMKTCKFVFEAHTLPTSEPRKTLERWLLRSSSVARLVVISNALRDDYLKSYPFQAVDDIVVAHDAADLPSSFEQAKAPIGAFASDRFRVGYVGHLYPGKGMETISKLAGLMPDIEFHVIGGANKDLAYWKAKVSHPNLIFHGFIPHSNLSQCYLSLDVMLAPFQEKTSTRQAKDDISPWMSPLKIFEYMAHGKAIIATELPVIKEILRDKFNALLVSANDLDAWQAAIELLQTNQELRMTLGNNGRKEMLEKHTWKRRAEKVLGGL